MRYLSLFCFMVFATAASAQQLSEQQSVALQRVLPQITKQVPSSRGELLAQCVVRVASKAELNALTDNSADKTSQQIINDIMARSATVDCFTEKLSTQ